MPDPLYHMPEVQKRQDFISVYSYHNAYPQIPDAVDGLSDSLIYQRDDYLEYQCQQLHKLSDQMGKNKECHISEWGFSVSNRNILNDTVFKAAYIVKNCINIIGQVDVLAYWMRYRSLRRI